jgi:hypothetical protein
MTGDIKNNFESLSVIFDDVIDQVQKMPEKGMYPIGALVPRQGIFIGQWEYQSAQNKEIKKTFNVFAAPEDFPKACSYGVTENLLKSLKDWHGHDGIAYYRDLDFYAAIDRNKYKGEWILPPRDMMQNTLFPVRNMGALSGTFQSATNYYWSSTEGAYEDTMRAVSLADGKGMSHGESCDLNSRLVRLVEFKL